MTTTDDHLTSRADELARQLSTRPEDSSTHAELADVTAKLGDYASAIDHDARAWELRPGDPSPIFHILTLLVDSGKWLGAMTAFEIVRESARPETAFALDFAATQVFRRIVGVFPPRGAHADADRLVDRLVASSRLRRAAIQVEVARALIDLGRLAEAGQLLEDLEGDAALRAHVWFLRAVLCERAGDDAGAIAGYELALDLDAQRTDAVLNLLSLLVESPAPDATARTAALLAQLAPAVRDLPLVRFREAIYLRRSGDHDGATALLSKLAMDRSTELGRMARQVLASC